MSAGPAMAELTGVMSRRFGFHGKRMQACVKFAFQKVIDHAVALDAAHSGKGRTDNPDPDMRPALPVKTRLVTRMQVAFIDNDQLAGRKPVPEDGLDRLCAVHGEILPGALKKGIHKDSNLQISQFLLLFALNPIIAS